VTEDEVGLVIGEDHLRRAYILIDESHCLGHVHPVLVAAIHPRTARLAECEAHHDQEEGDGNSAIPPPSREQRYGHADSGYRRNNQQRHMPGTAIRIHMSECNRSGGCERQDQEGRQPPRRIAILI